VATRKEAVVARKSETRPASEEPITKGLVVGRGRAPKRPPAPAAQDPRESKRSVSDA
jgi:hypothetical protein